MRLPQHIAAKQKITSVKNINSWLAHQYKWSPIVKGGFSTKAQKLRISGNRAIVSRNLHISISILFFLATSVAAFSIGIPYTLLMGAYPITILFFLFGLMFSYAAWAITSKSPKIVFDKTNEHYIRGSGMIHEPEKRHMYMGPLSEIKALQLVAESVTISGRHTHTYTSYELNMVLRNGERVNVMDHAVRKSVEEDALSLGRFLNVRVWSR